MLLPVLLTAGALLLQVDTGMLGGLYAQEFERHPTAQAARDLGMFLRRHGDSAGARNALKEALRLDDASASPQALDDAFELALASPGSEAAPLLTRAAASKDPRLAARALETLGHLRDIFGDKPAAVECYRRALTLQENAATLEALAADLDPAAAVPLLERALALNRALGLRHPQVATTEANLSGALLNAGRTDDAIRLARDAIGIFEEALGPGHPRTASAATILAWALRAKGDTRAALLYYQRALAIDQAAFGSSHPQTQADAKTLDDFQRELSGPP